MEFFQAIGELAIVGVLLLLLTAVYSSDVRYGIDEFMKWFRGDF